jgi:hypothetical protein
MAKEKINKLVLGLIIVIVVLLGVLGYAFLLSPAINGFVTSQQTQGAQYGVQYAIAAIMQQAAKCPTGGVPLTSPLIGNQTISITAVGCPQ